MASFYLAKSMYSFFFISITILILVLIFYWNYNSEYLFDIYSLNNLVKEYEHLERPIADVEITKWRNIYKHPLVLPTIISSNNI